MYHSHFNSIHSTQIYLRDNLAELQNHSAEILVSASEQTLGIGRRGNQWDTHANSIAMSFTLAPNPVPTLTPIEIGLLSVLFFKKEFGAFLKLKWPNDLLTPEGKKCGGIIAQYIDTKTVVAGLGLNLGGAEQKETPSHYKHGLGSVIPQLRLATEDHKSVAQKVYSYILKNRIFQAGIVEELFQEHCFHINSLVELDDDGAFYQGIFLGIGKNGEARIEIEGSCQSFLSSSLKILEKN